MFICCPDGKCLLGGGVVPARGLPPETREESRAGGERGEGGPPGSIRTSGRASAGPEDEGQESNRDGKGSSSRGCEWLRAPAVMWGAGRLRGRQPHTAAGLQPCLQVRNASLGHWPLLGGGPGPGPLED